MKYIVVIDEAPRSKRRTVYIAKMRGGDTFVYDTWAKCAYASEAVDRVMELNARLEEAEQPVRQTSGPQCKKCGAFTTKARMESHGLCMKCEHEAKVSA